MGIQRMAICIPTYREKPLLLDIIALERNIQAFYNRKIYFLVPKGLNTSWYEEVFKDLEIIRFDKAWFASMEAYNQMLMNLEFYRNLANMGLDFILICQLDVWVFHDSINDFVDLHYDYIGAPTLVRMNEQGEPELFGANGGFSLRHVSTFMRILDAHKVEADQWTGNEDEFFSFCGEKYPKEFRVAPKDIAMRFAFDRFSRYMYRKNQKRLPMAWHGWLTYDPEFSHRFIVSEHMQDIECKMNFRTYTDAMREFHSFVGMFPCIYIYGAGLWGKAVFQYLKAKNVMVRWFIVSDDQPLGEGAYQGVSIYHLSEICENVKGCGVIFSIGKRYLAEETAKRLDDNIRNGGFQHLLYLDAVTYNGIVEELLAIQERGVTV